MAITYVPLLGSERTPVSGARAVAPTEPTESIDVTLRLRRKASIPKGLVERLGATLPARRRYLTHAQLEQRFGAASADLRAVRQFARSRDLALVSENAAARTVTVRGPAAAMTDVFQVKLMRFEVRGTSYRGRVGPVRVPQALESVITGIFGLDNRPQARHHAIIRPLAPGTSRAVAQRPWFTPLELGSLYNFPAGDGTGQCIGILEFGGGYDDTDLSSYFTALGLAKPSITAVGVGGASNQPGVDQGADGEVMLDIEVAGALAPKAKLAVYFTDFTEKGWVDVVTTAVHDTKHAPHVLSISWGYAEGNYTWTQAAIAAVNEAFQEAALLGMSVCVASGDDGSADDVEDGHAHVDFPASSPYVLGIGGTSLRGAGGQISGETVWNNHQQRNAGGGGISDVFPLPDWQTGTRIPPSVNPGGRVGRGVPDLAANADPNTGYFVRSSGQDGVAGGTSAAAPLWSALLARINQGLGAKVGYFNPLLYSKIGPARVCRDVVTGNNDPNGHIGGYPAGSGWDACTGWGSPNGAALLTALGSGAPTKRPRGGK